MSEYTHVPKGPLQIQEEIARELSARAVIEERLRIFREVVGPLVEASQDMYVAFNLALVHGQIPAGTENSYCAEAVRAALAKAREQMGEP